MPPIMHAHMPAIEIAFGEHFVTRARPSRPAPIFDRASRWGGGQCVQWLVRPSFELKSIAGRENNTQMKAWEPHVRLFGGMAALHPERSEGPHNRSFEYTNFLA